MKLSKQLKSWGLIILLQLIVVYLAIQWLNTHPPILREENKEAIQTLISDTWHADFETYYLQHSHWYILNKEARALYGITFTELLHDLAKSHAQ